MSLNEVGLDVFESFITAFGGRCERAFMPVEAVTLRKTRAGPWCFYNQLSTRFFLIESYANA
jgi:hypothetical protein